MLIDSPIYVTFFLDINCSSKERDFYLLNSFASAIKHNYILMSKK